MVLPSKTIEPKTLIMVILVLKSTKAKTIIAEKLRKKNRLAIERFLKLNEKVKKINKNNNKISCPDKPKSVNECTLALPKMPLRVRKVAYNTIKKENMVSIKVSTGYLLVDLLINNMWVAVISNSQGIREAFSTGSQAQ